MDQKIFSKFLIMYLFLNANEIGLIDLDLKHAKIKFQEKIIIEENI